MKYLLSLLFFGTYFSLVAQLNTPPRQGQERKVQVAILFDTSNSMDGLIDQAQTRIWSIINTLAKLNYQGVRPSLEIALYEYGNSTLSQSSGYIRQLNGFSSDLDNISSSLFKLTTNGGNEFCGSVIKTSLEDLKWSKYPEDIRLVYIAGNEPFNQGTDNYIEVLNNAKKMDVYVNTIYCGPYQKGVEELWLSGAEEGQGKYLNIDSNKKIQHIKTPYDDTITKLNAQLNKTYITYGKEGKKKKELQVQEDMNAEVSAPASAVERTVSKSSRYYKNESWDLVDYVSDDMDKVASLDKDQLPDELKDMSNEERKAYIKAKRIERESIQSKIQDLARKRSEYITAHQKEEDAEDDFGKAVERSIKEFAAMKEFTLESL